ncbi:2-isopropylmalate synthase [bacterium BMS3Abin05]|nr:2-isopropylmalate synthase [bacterium BMS3Abin05]HDZ12058.1 2-isopropylmalate synthase [Bacteroidota bacterium]
MKRITIFDTTLRDGEQSPGASMNTDEKIQMARQLARLNVDVIEAGFPVASEGDFEAVRRIAGEIKGVTIAALARANEVDIERAWSAVMVADRPRIHTFIATSDIHLNYKLNKSREEVLEDAVRAVKLAKSTTEDVEFSAEDASRTDPEFLIEIFTKVIEAGATVINIPDTVGYAVPSEFGALIKRIRTSVPNIEKAVISVHCHNDLGLAVANSLAAVENGARQVECTINGIGERAGNASLEEVVMALKTRQSHYQVNTEINTKEIYRSSKLLTSLTGIFVARNKAIIGRNAFAHEAGIHQDGVLKNPLTYEIMMPQMIGIPANEIVLGKHSGRHALKQRFEELGYRLDADALDKAYRLFTTMADKKKEIYNEDLIAIVNNEIFGVPQYYKLNNLQVHVGIFMIPTATVELVKGNEKLVDSSTGDGPVDAVYRAIERVTKFSGKLVDYSIRSVTSGKDAIGEVFVKIEFEDGVYNGRAASTDIVLGSANAYLDALNRALYRREQKNRKMKVA